MISKKEFDLLLQEIFQIENKIVEIKVLNRFDKVSEYEKSLENIRSKAKGIEIDNSNVSNGFDEISLEVLSRLIQLDSDINYYILKASNVVEGTNENKIDAEALKKIKQSLEELELDVREWNKLAHNPIEEIEYNKQVSKRTMDIIVYQLEIEGILDFARVFNCCPKEYLENAIKEVLFEGAKNEIGDEKRRNRLINLARDINDKSIYDYKVWQEVLMIMDVKARNGHIEMIGNFQEGKKTRLVDTKFENMFSADTQQNLELFDESLFKGLKGFFARISENSKQRKMESNWKTVKGPAFQAEFGNGMVKYSKEYLDKFVIENAKKLTIATNGVAKYNFEKEANWRNLEEIEFLEGKNIASVNLSPDRTYSCIGNDSFSGCMRLKNISFGEIEMIGGRAFKDCINLSSVIFPKSVKNIGEDAFLNCSNLRKATFLGNLQLYILERPQNVINCFKGTKLEEIIFPDVESVFNFAIVDCPLLKRILVSNISIPFKVCKYRLGRQEGIVSFVGANALNLWKKKNNMIRFFELTNEDKEKYSIN